MSTTRAASSPIAIGLACVTTVGCLLIDPLPDVKLPPEGGAVLATAAAGAAGDAASGGATAVAGGTGETGTVGGRSGAGGSSAGEAGLGGDGGNARNAGVFLSGGASGSVGAAGSTSRGSGDSAGTAGESGDGGAGGAAVEGPAGSPGMATGGAGTGGMATGGAGACGPEGPSCAGGLTCDDGGTSCCKSLVVEGGSYERAPGESPSYPATVSSFCLDKYEVTVGRVRMFVEAYDEWRGAGHPGLSEGSHPTIGAPSGWQTEWTAELPANATQFKDTTRLNSDSTYRTWRDFAGTQAAERLPINFVSWYEAFAFCIWDGGRLPTEAEWQYAAQGGTLNREYPWGNEAPSSTRAVFDCMGNGSSECSYADILPVGSKPDGDGYWQQSDLAGSMWEWNLDWYAAYPETCNHCANTEAADYRVNRGGSWTDYPAYLHATFRGTAQSGRYEYLGLRCARAAQ